MPHLPQTAYRVVRAMASSAAAGSAPQKISLVQGASRGLGLEFVTQLLHRPDQHVVAACRNPSAATQLLLLKQQHPSKLDIVQLDTTDESSIEKAAEEVKKGLGISYLNLLLNVSGVLHNKETNLAPETALARVTLANLQTNFASNTFGPILVSKAFAPLLANAAKEGGATDEHPAVIANMSARVGSIGDNKIGGWYSYRASKTALNQLTKCMSIELARKKQKVACILLHPGTVDTDLSKPFQGNVPEGKLFTKEQAIKQLLEIIDGTSMAETGGYFAWDGQRIEW